MQDMDGMFVQTSLKKKRTELEETRVLMFRQKCLCAVSVEVRQLTS